MEFSLGGWLAQIWKDNPKEKKHTLYVGIDGGSQGGIGFVYGDHHVAVDIPTYKTKVKGSGRRKNRTDYDLDRIVGLFGGVTGFNGNIKAAVEVAVPQMSYGKTPYAAFRVAMGYYMWPLFLKQKGFEVYEVHPITWKNKLGLKGKSKKRAMKKARKLFPNAELHLAKHEGRCEALLIADYLSRTLEDNHVETAPDRVSAVQGRSGRNDSRAGRGGQAVRVQRRDRD